MGIRAFIGASLATAVLSAPALAAVTPVAYWQFGDKPGDTSGSQDSVGSNNWNINPTTSVQSGGAPVAGNDKYLATPAAGGLYGVPTSLLPTDNFGVELWVRTGTTQNQALYVTDGTTPDNSLKIIQEGSNWSASYHNAAWIGAANGAGQPVTPDAWQHLAVVRDGGVSTFYINGVAQSSPTNAVPFFGTGTHLSVNPGGTTGWDGDLDEMRYFTFAPGQFNAQTDLLVPEPASLGLLGLGSIGLLARRRRHW